MSQLDKSGPAFPVPCSGSEVKYFEGMTLRQWYAGMALQGMIGRVDAIYSAGMARAEAIAEWAYEQADAMLQQREATP